MDGGIVQTSQTFRVDSARGGRYWMYQGIGCPRSLAEIRLGIVAVVVVVALTVWGYVSIGPNGRIVPGRKNWHRTDFTVFTEAGAAFFDGRNPYRVTNPRGWHYLYPPLFALLVAPLSILDTESQVVVWYVVNVSLAFGCFGEARRLWRLLAGPDRHRSHWVGHCVLLAALLPFLDCMQSGQLGIAILTLLLIGCRLVLQGRSWPRWFLGGLTLAVPAVVKLVPSLPVLFLLGELWCTVLFRGRGRRRWGQATTSTAGVLTGVFLFLLVIPAALIGWQKNLHYLRVWHERIVTNERVGPNANFNIHSFRNQSLANAVYLWGRGTRHTSANDPQSQALVDRPERIVHPAVRGVIGAILTLLVAVGLVLGRRESGLDQVTAWGLACCATLLVSPLSWGHYYMAEVPALIGVPIWLSRRGMAIPARCFAVIPAVLSWSYYLAMPYTAPLGLLGLGTTAWFMAACGLILWVEVSTAFGRTRSHLAGSQHSGIAVLSRPHRLRSRNGAGSYTAQG